VPGSCVTVFPGSPDRVVIHGDIDIRNAPEIDDAFSALTGDVQVDCVGVGFIDTAGFHALDRAYDTARARGSSFTVSGLNTFATLVGEFLGSPYLSK